MDICKISLYFLFFNLCIIIIFINKINNNNVSHSLLDITTKDWWIVILEKFENKSKNLGKRNVKKLIEYDLNTVEAINLILNRELFRKNFTHFSNNRINKSKEKYLIKSSNIRVLSNSTSYEMAQVNSKNHLKQNLYLINNNMIKNLIRDSNYILSTSICIDHMLCICYREINSYKRLVNYVRDLSKLDYLTDMIGYQLTISKLSSNLYNSSFRCSDALYRCISEREEIVMSPIIKQLLEMRSFLDKNEPVLFDRVTELINMAYKKYFSVDEIEIYKTIYKIEESLLIQQDYSHHIHYLYGILEGNIKLIVNYINEIVLVENDLNQYYLEYKMVIETIFNNQEKILKDSYNLLSEYHNFINKLDNLVERCNDHENEIEIKIDECKEILEKYNKIKKSNDIAIRSFEELIIKSNKNKLELKNQISKFVISKSITNKGSGCLQLMDQINNDQDLTIKNNGVLSELLIKFNYLADCARKISIIYPLLLEDILNKISLESSIDETEDFKVLMLTINKRLNLCVPICNRYYQDIVDRIKNTNLSKEVMQVYLSIIKEIYFESIPSITTEIYNIAEMYQEVLIIIKLINTLILPDKVGKITAIYLFTNLNDYMYIINRYSSDLYKKTYQVKKNCKSLIEKVNSYNQVKTISQDIINITISSIKEKQDIVDNQILENEKVQESIIEINKMIIEKIKVILAIILERFTKIKDNNIIHEIYTFETKIKDMINSLSFNNNIIYYLYGNLIQYSVMNKLYIVDELQNSENVINDLKIFEKSLKTRIKYLEYIKENNKRNDEFIMDMQLNNRVSNKDNRIMQIEDRDTYIDKNIEILNNYYEFLLYNKEYNLVTAMENSRMMLMKNKKIEALFSNTRRFIRDFFKGSNIINGLDINPIFMYVLKTIDYGLLDDIKRRLKHNLDIVYKLICNLDVIFNTLDFDVINTDSSFKLSDQLYYINYKIPLVNLSRLNLITDSRQWIIQASNLIDLVKKQIESQVFKRLGEDLYVVNNLKYILNLYQYEIEKLNQDILNNIRIVEDYKGKINETMQKIIDSADMNVNYMLQSLSKKIINIKKFDNQLHFYYQAKLWTEYMFEISQDFLIIKNKYKQLKEIIYMSSQRNSIDFIKLKKKI